MVRMVRSLADRTFQPRLHPVALHGRGRRRDALPDHGGRVRRPDPPGAGPAGLLPEDEPAGGLGLGWKVRSARDRTIRTFPIRVRSKLCQNSGNFARIHRESIKIKILKHFLEQSAKFRQNFIKIWVKISEKNSKMTNFANFAKNAKKFDEKFLKYWGLSGAKACKSCRSRQELSN